jgi:hypothetical protein
MDNARRLSPLACWTVGLIISLAFLHGAGPHPQSISGNGFLPGQMLFLVTTMVLVVVWVRTLFRVAGVYARQLRWQPRLGLGLAAVGLAIFLVTWSYTGLHQYEQTLQRFYRPGSLVNAYTLGYWSFSYSFWIGLAALVTAVAFLWPKTTRLAR